MRGCQSITRFLHAAVDSPRIQLGPSYRSRRTRRTESLHPHPIIRHARVSTTKRELARRLRREATASERAAWQLLRDRRCHELKFLRQQPIGGYIVDFYCAEPGPAPANSRPPHLG